MQKLIPFDVDIHRILSQKLMLTVYGRVGMVDDRAYQLMNIHKAYIILAKKKLDAKAIADALYKYELNLTKTF